METKVKSKSALLIVNAGGYVDRKRQQNNESLLPPGVSQADGEVLKRDYSEWPENSLPPTDISFTDRKVVEEQPVGDDALLPIGFGRKEAI